MNTPMITLSRKETLGSLIYLALYLFFLPGLILFASDALHLGLNAAQLNTLFYALNFFCIVLLCHRFFRASLQNFAAQVGNILLAAASGLVLYWVCSWLLGLVIPLLFPDFQNLNDAVMADMAQQNFWLLFCGVVFLVPPVEEVLFRGLFFGTLYRRTRAGAYLVSTVLFASIHIIGYIGTISPLTALLSLIQYLPAGFCLAWAYRHTGNIMTPVLMHLCVNIVGIIAMR